MFAVGGGEHGGLTTCVGVMEKIILKKRSATVSNRVPAGL